jgi:hypothetical protein
VELIQLASEGMALIVRQSDNRLFDSLNRHTPPWS